MLIESDTLIGLPAITQKGVSVGKISGLIVETDGQTVHQYTIKSHGIAHLFDKEILVNRTQVVAITKDHVTIRDAVVEEPSTIEHAPKKRKASTIEQPT